jgi:hypothetical protein
MADILNASIADNGHLILVLADGSTIDAGQTRGIPGAQGERGVGVKGDPGLQGPPGTVAGSANQVLYKDNTNTAAGSTKLTFDGTNLSVPFVSITASSGDEGGEMLLAKPQTNSTIAGPGVTIDVYQNRLRFFEQGGTARGAYIDITAMASGASTALGFSPTQVQNSITLGATTTAPTGGTRTVQRIEYQTMGDGMWLTYKLGMTGTTVGAGDYLLSLPTGVQFNTTANPVYTGALWAGGCAAMAPYFVPTMGGITIPGWWSNMIMVVPYDATRFRLALTGNGDQSKYLFWSTGFYATNSDISLQLQFEIWR